MKASSMVLLLLVVLPSQAADQAEHHDFSPAIAGFHDVLAPLWHAPAGEQRAKNICSQSPQFVTKLNTIRIAETPEKADPDKWNHATEQLNLAVSKIVQTCTDKKSPEPALSVVHQRFHDLVRLTEQNHTTSALSADDDIDYIKVSNAFSECSALQNTLAGIIANNEDEYENHSLHHAANDALTVATDFAVVGGYDKAFVDYQYDTYYARFQNMLEASTPGYQAFSAEVKPIIEKCASLNQIQTQLMAARTQKNTKTD